MFCGKVATKFLGFVQAKTRKDMNFVGIDSIPAWSKDRKELFILGIVSISLLLSVFSHMCGLSLEAGALISGLLFSKCNHGEKVSGLMDSLTQVFGALVGVLGRRQGWVWGWWCGGECVCVTERERE